MLKDATAENCLTLLCFSEQHAPGLVLRLTPETFRDRIHKKLAHAAFDYIERFNAPPGVHLRDVLEDDLRRGDEGKRIKQTITAMEELFPQLRAEYVLAEVDKFIELSNLESAVEAAFLALEAKDPEKAREALFNVKVNTKSDRPGFWLTNGKEALSFLDKKSDEDIFSSGVDELDKRNIRPARGTLFLGIGTAKSGKSWWLTEIGKRGALDRKVVVHITLENSAPLAAKRYVQSLFALSSEEISSIRIPQIIRNDAGQFSKLEWDTIRPETLNASIRTKVEKKLAQLNGRFRLYIQEFPTGMLTVPQLNAWLDSFERTEGAKPDLLLVDYADLMSIDARNLRVDTGRLFRELRGLCVQRNCAGVTMTQGNRISATAKVVSTNMVAEDWSKIGTADTVCSYAQTSEERDINMARIMVAAARDAADKYIVWIAQSYATGQFALDSCYMSKYVEDAVARIVGEENGAED